MTQQELLICLHQYTPWELLHRQNLNKAENMEQFNQTMDVPLGEADKFVGLHLPYVPVSGTFSEALFFPKDSGQIIQVVQHDRYVPPGLHQHDFFEMVYVYEGEFVQQIGARKFLMHTGDLCLLPPGIYHALDVNNYSIVLNILIQKAAFREIILNALQESSLFSGLLFNDSSASSSGDYLIFQTNGDLDIQRLVLELCMETLNKGPYYQLIMTSHLLRLLGLLLRRYEQLCECPAAKQSRETQNIQIIRYIDQHYQTVTLQKLANLFHYSLQHMSTRVKQITGIPFTDYLLQKRMQMASDLLISTTIKVGAVGEAIGYRNQEHFIRVFRKYYGKSPGVYRNLHQDNHLQSQYAGGFCSAGSPPPD